MPPTSPDEPVDPGEESEGDISTTPIVAGVILVVAATAVSVPLFVLPDGTDEPAQVTPDDVGSSDHYGTIVVMIDGENVTLESGNDAIQLVDNRTWHATSDTVTLEYALKRFGVNVSEGGDTVEIGETTYCGCDLGTEVTVTVNGEPVDPEQYVLHGPADRANASAGDSIRVVVTTA